MFICLLFKDWMFPELLTKSVAIIKKLLISQDIDWLRKKSSNLAESKIITTPNNNQVYFLIYMIIIGLRPRGSKFSLMCKVAY